jgi:hypothetical protein
LRPACSRRHDVGHHGAAGGELRGGRRAGLAARPAGSGRLRAVWGAVLLAGVPFAIAGTRPTIPLGFGEVSVIVFAQVANGILLPAIAVFLLVAANDRSLHILRYQSLHGLTPRQCKMWPRRARTVDSRCDGYGQCT